MLWIDMQDPTAFTESAGAITSITNKVTDEVWDEGTMPAYSATAINSKPGMDFNGTTHHIFNVEAAVWAAVQDANAYTLFYVGHHDAANRTEAAVGVGNSGVATNQTRSWGAGSAGNWRSQSVNNAGTSVTVLSTGVSDTNVHKFCWHSPGTTVSLEIDGGTADPSGAAQNPGTLTPDRSGLGARPDSAPDQFLNGQVGEVLLYDSDLSAANIAAVFAYLARWNP